MGDRDPAHPPATPSKGLALEHGSRLAWPAVEAVERAYVDYSQVVRRYLLVRVRDPDAADDLTQDVFVEALKAARAGSTDAPSLAWLLAVAHRRWIDELRKTQVRSEWLRAVSAASRGRPPASRPPTLSIAETLLEAARELSHDDQLLVSARLFEQRPFDEIAADLEATRSACKMRFVRARRRIQASFDAADVGIDSIQDDL